MSLKVNTAWNLAGSGIPMLLGLITVPYLIHKIGVESFGILTLVWALIGYFSIFDFGIGRALTHNLSTHRAAGLSAEVPALVKTGLEVMLVTGTIGGVALAIGAHQLGYRWLNVSQALQEATSDSLLVAAVGIPISTVTSGLKGVLEGYEDFRVASILRMLLGMFNFGLPALTAMVWTPSLVYLVLSLVVARLLILAAHVVAVHERVSVVAIARVASSRPERTTAMLSFGAWMTTSNIISPLMVTADRFIISFMLGASVVAYYTVPFDIIVRLLVIPAALTGTLFPRFAYLLEGEKGAVRALYRKSLQAILAVMLAICLAMAGGSYWGLKLWVGSSFAEKSWLIAATLAVGLLFNSLAQVPHTAIQAAGNVKATALVHLSEFILYLPLLYLSLQLYGLLGAAVVWVLRVVADFIILGTIARRLML